MEESPKMNTDLHNVIIIDNLPVVPQAKVEKLYNVINKIINQFQCAALQFELCQNESGETTGYAFVEYETPADAERAILKMNNQRLDKSHIFKVCLFSDWELFEGTPEEYAEPEQLPVQEVERLQEWLLDDTSREQYLIHHNEETEVWWNDMVSLTKQTQIKKKANWTESFVRWSPLGSYMATFHQPGIQLWGGADWKALGKFPHTSVQLLDFSPKETYLVTWFNNLAVWDVSTQKKLRSFPTGPTPEYGWPVFKWAHDEQYFAKISEDNINIFDSSTMKLIQPDPKKPTTLYVPGVKSFEWSPSENIISYWVPESGDQPARVVLLRLVKKKVKKDESEMFVDFEQVTQKHLFRVVDIRMHWQSLGEFLCVKVDRYSKGSKSKSKVTSFELFRMKNKSVGIEVVELTDEVIAFSWEPRGLRFGVIHGIHPNMDVSFYTMSDIKSGNVKCVGSLKKKHANHLFWSPRGNYIVLAGLGKQTNGILEFWNVNLMEHLGSGEHYNCTNIEWDPSGRFVATYVSQFQNQSETGYAIWTFQGKNLVKLNRARFSIFSWRPRPETLLTDTRQKAITKTLSSRAAKYQKEEKELERMEADQHNRHRREKVDEFQNFIKSRLKEMKEMTKARRAARRNCDYDSEDDSCLTTVDDMVEEILSVEETEIPQ